MAQEEEPIEMDFQPEDLSSTAPDIPTEDTDQGGAVDFDDWEPTLF